MLTIDKLKGVELLKELTPEQLEVIENMSNAIVTGKQIGRAHV